MNSQSTIIVNRVCWWISIFFVILFVIGFVPLARFIPPPPPSLSVSEVVALYGSNLNGIRAGMVLAMWAAACYIGFTALIAHFLLKVEGRFGPLSVMQVLGGGATALLFFYPPLWWLAASYRIERDPNLIYLLHDAAWLQFVGGFATFAFQLLPIFLAALLSNNASKVFPRWYGFLTIFVIPMSVSDQLLFFFHSGPFAWNGILAWWTAATAFFIWFFTTMYLFRKGINQEENELSKETDVRLS